MLFPDFIDYERSCYTYIHADFYIKIISHICESIINKKAINLKGNKEATLEGLQKEREDEKMQL